MNERRTATKVMITDHNLENHLAATSVAGFLPSQLYGVARYQKGYVNRGCTVGLHLEYRDAKEQAPNPNSSVDHFLAI